MAAKTQLSIVILSYNVRKLLSDCLKSLLDDPDSSHWQIIIVDNASSDDTVEWLKKRFDLISTRKRGEYVQSANKRKSSKAEIKLIVNSVNLGFAAGNNLAIPSIKYDYVLFLNPDTVVHQGTITRILKFVKSNKQVGAATCKVVLDNGKLDDGCHRGFPSPWNSFCYFSGLSKLFPDSKIFNGYTMSYEDLNTIHEIDSLTGAFMLLSTKVGKKVGWWDDDYFFNADDLDFCYRIKRAGYKVMYIPDVEIVHYKGASAGYKPSSYGKSTVASEVKVRSAKSSTEAMRIFYQKHYAKKYPWLINWIMFAGISLLEKYRLYRLK